MSVYVVAHLNIADRNRYADYEAGFMDVFAKFEGEVIAVDDQAEVLEGSLNANRCVILRFPDRERLGEWYESADYQSLLAIRAEASDGVVAVIRGF